MTKEELRNIAHMYYCNIDDICDLIYKLLLYKADQIEKKEPYALRTIENYRKAARVVGDFAAEIYEILSEEE